MTKKKRRLKGINPSELSSLIEEDFDQVKSKVIKELLTQLVSRFPFSYNYIESDPTLQELIKEFHTNFYEHKGLPSSKDQGQHTVIQFRIKLVCVGPYRCPYFQKA